MDWTYLQKTFSQHSEKQTGKHGQKNVKNLMYGLEYLLENLLLKGVNMPFEDAKTIRGLDVTWPLGVDPVHDGDDHIRSIKTVLKTIFAGSATDPANAGFDRPITVDPSDINELQGIKGNVQDQLDALESRPDFIAPIGTRMVFQGTLPNGWVAVTGLNNRFLRVDSDSFLNDNNGGDAGTEITVKAHDHSTGDFALAESNIPAHSHATSGHYINLPRGTFGSSVNYWIVSGGSTTSTSSLMSSYGGGTGGKGAPHNHGRTGLNTDQVIKPSYTNIVIARKV